MTKLPRLKPKELAALKARCNAMPPEQAEARVEEICRLLLGSGVSFSERLALNDERSFLRARKDATP